VETYIETQMAAWWVELWELCDS